MTLLRTTFLVIVLIGCGSNGAPPEPTAPRSSQKISESDLRQKDKSAVEALLGAPLKKSRWKNTAPPQGATAEQLAAFEAEELDEIWIYANRRVHFSVGGKVIKVDDKVSRDLPP